MDKLLTELKAVLSTTPQRWNSLAQAFSEDLLRRQPLPGEWSALECLLHLIDLDRKVFPQRVRAIIAGGRLPAFFPDQESTHLSDAVSAAGLATEFETLRAENLKLLETITPDKLNSEATHSELGVVTLSQLLHEWGAHDLMHLVQAERALMQPFIAGCGPWHVYFSEHVAVRKI